MKKMKNSLLIIFLCSFVGCLHFGTETKTIYAFDLKKVQFDEQTYPVVICGGGPGGLTSAIYLAQANIKTLVLEGINPGGAITMSHSVRNWPGEKNITGKKLMDKVKEQAIENGAIIATKEVIGVNFSIWPYIISVKDLLSGQTQEVKALTCIIAMGTKPNYLSIPGEQEYWGKGVSNCATCDGPLYKDKIVAIVGGGDSAIEEANILSRIAKKVLILVRSNKLKAKAKFAQEVQQKSNVTIFYNTIVKEIVGDNKKITKLIVFNTNDKKEYDLQIDGLFLAIGSTPNTKLFENEIELNPNGYILLKKEQQTTKNGIFAIGDISDPKYKQAITAAGDGCKAALQAQNFLEKIGYNSDLQKITNSNPKTITQKDTNQVLEITGSEFNKIIVKSNLPIVVDFFATWCMPCQRMAPIFENVAADFANKIKFVKIDISKNQNLAEQFGVSGVPTFIFIKNGKFVKKIVGAKNQEEFKALVEKAF